MFESNKYLTPKKIHMTARIAHIIPGLSSHSLMSVVKLCDAGCKDEMEEFLCEIKYNGITIINAENANNLDYGWSHSQKMSVTKLNRK